VSDDIYSRLILVGERNLDKALCKDPRWDLHPFPARSLGGRLCRKVCGLPPATYARLPRVNLVHAPKWSLKEGRRAAAEVMALHREKMIVLLGSRVCRAFGVDFAPFSFYSAGAYEFLILPHPAGLSPFWTGPESYARAQSMLRMVAPGVPFGEPF
jgi:hypothetical protein